MAKYNRHDPRNKKKNKHKQYSKEGRQNRMRVVGEKHRWTNEMIAN